LAENDFVQAEANYRRAISESDENVVAPYNLGTAYYDKASYGEAFGRFKEAGELATEKMEKHKAYHNMGNVFMKKKEYEKAVEAYKEALRNDPTDEETRYNLALAKEMLKKEQDEQNKDDNDKEKEDKKEEKEENKDKEENNGDKNQDDKKEKGDDGDQEKEDNKEGEGDQKQEAEKQPEQGDKPDERKEPRPNQLSPQQIRNLLEAMQNEEKKVQEKLDAQKVKGAKMKNEKDW
jgi:tetratricopeptide (TPR) repeat protein